MKQKIVIVGAGFAGVWSALSATRLLDEHNKLDEIEVTLIAPQPELHVRPRLYETNAAQMKAPLRELFEAVGVQFMPGTVENIDDEASILEVAASDGSTSTVAYDRLVLATGSQLFRPDVPGLREHGFSVDQLDDAVALEEHITRLADEPDSSARNTVVVAGGGFTGIEAAAEMPARLRAALGKDTPVRVLIVERADDIGPDLGPGPRPVITKALAELGVECKLGTTVTAIDPSGLTTSTGERIESKTVIWTAGLRASPLAAQVAGPKDQYGRIHVDDDLRVPGSKGIFATGDAALATVDDQGNYAMMSCQHATALGRTAGHNVAASILGLPTLTCRQPNYVTCLDLGPWGAVLTEGWDRRVSLEGAEAKALKHSINTEWIYPPAADRDVALAAADPLQLVIA